MTDKERLVATDKQLDDVLWLLQNELADIERKISLIETEQFYRKNPECRT
jgi:hypothetical protein